MDCGGDEKCITDLAVEAESSEKRWVDYRGTFSPILTCPKCWLAAKHFSVWLHPCGEFCASQPDMVTDFIWPLSSMTIKVNEKKKFDIHINVKNKKDNAYNTKVIITFTPNINYVKVEVSSCFSAPPSTKKPVWQCLYFLTAREGMRSESHKGGLCCRLSIPGKQRRGLFSCPAHVICIIHISSSLLLIDDHLISTGRFQGEIWGESQTYWG